MLSDTILSTIVQSIIAGAGLVLAIYALIIPISRRMFIIRAKMLQDQVKLFEEQRNSLTPEMTNKEFKKLQQMAVGIKETRSFPRYLSLGVFFTFGLYILTAITTFSAWAGPAQLTSFDELFIIILFMVPNWLFAGVGLITIIDITTTMKKEFDGIKKKIEQDKEFQGLFVK